MQTTTQTTTEKEDKSTHCWTFFAAVWIKWLGDLAEFWNFLCRVFNQFSTLLSVTEWKFVGILEKVNNGAFKKRSGVKNNHTTLLFRDALETLKGLPQKLFVVL